MSKHKAIPKKKRLAVYEKFNHRCAYCGCEVDYKDMQVDHVESLHRYETAYAIGEADFLDEIENLMPSCRQCNFYKSTFSLEDFRERLQVSMMNNLRKNFGYNLALKYGLVEEKMKPIRFYFEEMRADRIIL